MNRGNINIIVVFFVILIMLTFFTIILSVHISMSVNNIKNDLFYIIQNSILDFSVDELGLKNYEYQKENIMARIKYLIKKNYEENIFSSNMIGKIEIEEMDFLKENETCSSNMYKDQNKIHIIINVEIKPPILKKYLKVSRVKIHEDVKFTLMEN